METALQWGLDCIRLIQSGASPPLTVFMRIITAFGSAAAYIIPVVFIFWCVDEQKGLRFGIMALVSIWVNLFLKVLLDQPRPFFPDYDPSLGMASAEMGGFPSGHAQNTLVMWAIVASKKKKKWFWGI
ncbi:MAG: phosphatase PAP2 family protein, partial [Treponema sp.]|nr:phosphatase PAP2 family protein [Treponema sp.]